MSQPLYFLPNLRGAQIASIPLMRGVLKERGLTDIFADVHFDQITRCELTGRGPDDKSGCILTYQRHDGQVPRRLGFYPQEQTWTPVGDGSLVWFGIDPSEPPTPEDMRRRKQHNGYRLTLGDGAEWTIPVIRRPDGSTELPTDMHWDAAGRFCEPIKPAYEAYWRESAEVAEWFFGNTDLTRLPPVHCVELGIRALSINYRFGVNEQNALRVIDRENYLTLLALTVDMPRAEEILASLKKTSDGPNTLNSGAGLADGCPTTDPAAATCS